MGADSENPPNPSIGLEELYVKDEVVYARPHDCVQLV
jgi:hypothetical protein